MIVGEASEVQKPPLMRVDCLLDTEIEKREVREIRYRYIDTDTDTYMHLFCLGVLMYDFVFPEIELLNSDYNLCRRVYIME